MSLNICLLSLLNSNISQIFIWLHDYVRDQRTDGRKSQIDESQDDRVHGRGRKK